VVDVGQNLERRSGQALTRNFAVRSERQKWILLRPCERNRARQRIQRGHLLFLSRKKLLRILNASRRTTGIENVTTASAFRGSFGEDYGTTIVDGPMAGLLARAVVVIGADGKVTCAQLVPEIAQEPDYDAALAALG
jgi:hypothetical protein